MTNLTKEQALKLFATEFWKTMSKREIAEFQLFESRLCMPFQIFHEALEDALGRPVFTHELGMNLEGIKAELRGEQGPPSFDEILALIPEEKRLVVLT